MHSTRSAFNLHRQKQLGLSKGITDEQYRSRLWKAIKETYVDYANQHREIAKLPLQNEKYLDDYEIDKILQCEENAKQHEQLLVKMEIELQQNINKISEVSRGELVGFVYEDEPLFDHNADIVNIAAAQMELLLEKLPKMAIKYWQEKIKLLHNQEKHLFENGNKLSKAAFMLCGGIGEENSLVHYMNSFPTLAIGLLKFPPFIAACLDDQEYAVEELFIQLLNKHAQDETIKDFLCDQKEYAEKINDMIRSEDFTEEYPNASALLMDVQSHQKERKRRLA